MKKEAVDIIMLSDFNRDAGGTETWLYNFLSELLKDNEIQQVRLFGYKDSIKDFDISASSFTGENNKSAEKKLVPIVLMGKPSRFPMALSMYRKLRNHKVKEEMYPTITLAIGVFPLIMMLFIKRFKKTQKIVWLRSIFIHEKAYTVPKFLRKILLQIEIYLLRKVDKIICNGDDIKEFYEKHNLQIHVIKNGIKINKWELPPLVINEPIHVVYIGRLSQVKGIESYLALAEKIKKGEKQSNFIFHVVGDEGVYKERVEVLAKENVIINHGVISNQKLPNFLKKIDVCAALTFASENGGGGGTSNAMLEQMAASRIMLAWDNIIFRQYLNNENAYLAKQYSINDLQKRLFEILENKEVAISKSIKAKESINGYTYAKNVEYFKKVANI